MEKFIKGDIVVLPFPFSDLTRAKRRPAVIAASLSGNDIILCQITSQRVRDRYAIELNDSDFETGTLRQKSNIRPNRLFTADTHIILYQAGHLKVERVNAVIEKVVEILRQ